MKFPEPSISRESELAGALHEVSNALTVVLGWLAEAQGNVDVGPARAAIEVAQTHARRGHRVARAAIGADAPESQAVRSARKLAQEALVATEREAQAKGVRLGIALDDADAMVSGADALLQVLVNLLLNAIAFTPEGREVRLELTAGAQEAVYTVIDQGPGVPPQQRAHLFEGGNSMRPGGAGIGLCHSHSLVEQSGGTLRLLRSGSGACFEVVWPTSEVPSQTVPRSAAATFLVGRKVLVLEDDDAVLSMVRFGLESRGAHVWSAMCLREVLELTAEHADFDLALLDLSPIKGDCPRALRALRQSQADLPLVLMSGSAGAGEVALDLAGRVQKPFELGELYEVLRTVMS